MRVVIVSSLVLLIAGCASTAAPKAASAPKAPAPKAVAFRPNLEAGSVERAPRKPLRPMTENVQDVRAR